MGMQLSGSLELTGSFTTSGAIVAQTLVVQTITSSITQMTGSNIFGSSLSNTQRFTGSVLVTGSLTVTTTGTELQVNPNGVNIGNALTDSHVISGSFRVNPSGLFVSGSGNVGIGTTSPNINLQIAGTNNTAVSNTTFWNYAFTGQEITNLSNTGSTVAGLAFVGGSSRSAVSAIGGVLESTSLQSLALFTGGSGVGGGSVVERMRITSGGSVGIGTSSPSTLLHLQSSASGGQNFRIQTSVAAGRNYMQFANGSGDMGYLGYGGADSKFYINNQLNDDMLFFTNSTEKMRITATGNVGIGTNSPNSNLTIYSANYPFMNIRNANSGVYGMTFGFATLNGDVDIWNYENSYVRIGTNNAERMRILNDGRVSIGTSSPTATTLYINATNNNGNAFRAGNFFAGAQSSGTDYPAIGYNMRFTSTSTIQYEANDYVSYIYFGIGRVDTYTAGAGSAGATVSATRGPFVNNGGTTWTNGSSDQRLKKNFETTQGLAEVLQIEPVKYHFNWEEDAATKRLGFKAQNLQSLIPEMVQPNGDKFEDGSDILTLTPDYLLPVLIKAIQELEARVKELENK